MSLNSHMALWLSAIWSYGHLRTCHKWKTSHLHFCKTYGRQNLQNCDCLWWAPTNRATRIFDSMITWGHVPNQKSYISASILSFLVTINKFWALNLLEDMKFTKKYLQVSLYNVVFNNMLSWLSLVTWWKIFKCNV